MYLWLRRSDGLPRFHEISLQFGGSCNFFLIIGHAGWCHLILGFLQNVAQGLSKGISGTLEDLELVHFRQANREIVETILHHREDSKRLQLADFIWQLLNFVTTQI